MKTLVIGAGSIGKRHLGNLHNLGLQYIAVCDKEDFRLDKVQQKYPDLTLYDHLFTIFSK